MNTIVGSAALPAAPAAPGRPRLDHKPGKGNTVVRSKLKHVLSGKVIDRNTVRVAPPNTISRARLWP